MKNRKRKKMITIYLSDDEYDLLKEKTKESNQLSISSYIRHLIVYGFNYEVDYKDLQQYNWYLSNISNNLNQIAHIANTYGVITNSDLKRSKELMEEVWQLQKYMLSNQPFRNQ